MRLKPDSVSMVIRNGSVSIFDVSEWRALGWRKSGAGNFKVDLRWREREIDKERERERERESERESERGRERENEGGRE